VIKFVSDLWQVSGFLWFPPPKTSETTRPVETKFCRNVLEIPYKKYSFQLDFIHEKFMVPIGSTENKKTSDA
jgi:hypothetical protein